MTKKLFHAPDQEFDELQQRLIFLKIGVVILIGLLTIRLWQLQVKDGAYYRDLSHNNQTRSILLRPPRGLIYDRNGQLLANNVPSFTLYVQPEDVTDRNALSQTLVTLLQFDPTELANTLNAGGSRTRIKLKRGLTLREAALIESHRLDLPGVVIQPEYQRNNPQGPFGAHVIGYVGEVSEEQLDTDAFAGVPPGSMIGKYGIERTYDDILRGDPGHKLIQVDALGHEKRILSVEKPLAGDDLFLSLDFRLQRLAEELLGEEAGAIVALDPQNGEVLALASRPSFDPTAISRGMDAQQWKTIIQDPRHPLTNRAIQGLYPPGSTFKIIMAAGALNSHTVTPSETIQCLGTYRFGNRLFRDWKAGGHGKVDLAKALTHSCDVYFYKVGNRMGIDTIATFSKEFGLGRKTGIDLPAERSGIVPSTEWKQQTRGEPWYPGETISVAIGQGFVTATPIQMANMIATVANGGNLHVPHLIQGVRYRHSGMVEPWPIAASHRVSVDPQWLATIKPALESVVTHGTAKKAQSTLVSIAGKTGTSQVVALRKDSRKDKKTPKEFRDHAWFVAYAPPDHPRIAVAVIVEHSGHGGSAAAPLAKSLIEAFITYYPDSAQGPSSDSIPKPAPHPNTTDQEDHA